MRKILIPVDFSGCSNNAVSYAAELSKQIDVSSIILMKSVYVSIYSTILPTVDLVQVSAEYIDEQQQKAEQQLELLKQELIRQTGPSVTVTAIISDDPVLRAVHHLIEAEQVTLVIVGNENDECRTDESYIVDEIIGISKTSSVPVLVVPGNYPFRKIKKAVLPCDFKALSRLNALETLSAAIGKFEGELLVLNVDPKQKHLQERAAKEKELAEALSSYHYQLHYSEEKNIIDGITHFAKQQDAQLVIALPGRHSFFYSLTHRSITEALAENGLQPVLILK